ncbi:MAG: YaiO family outer membrane beta-barrel protein [Bacteroidota bacterium]
MNPPFGLKIRSAAVLCLGFLLLFQTIEARAVTTATTEFPDSLYEAAVRLQQSGDLDGAKDVLRILLHQYPKYFDGRVLYARLLSWEDQYEESISQYDSVLIFESKHTDARLGKAVVLAWMKQYDESVSILLPLTEEYPGSFDFNFQLAQTYYWQGSYQKSYFYYDKSRLLNGSSEDAVRGLGRSSLKLRDDSAAVAWYRELLVLAPTDNEAQAEIQRLSDHARNELQIFHSFESFANSEVATQQVAGLDCYREVADNWKPYLHVEQVSKFSLRETRYGAGVYGSFAYGTGVFGQLLLSPGATVNPRMDAVAEISFPPAVGFEAILGYRLMSFENTTVSILIPGMTAYLSGSLWITTKGYFASSSDRSSPGSYTLAVSYRPGIDVLVQASGFSGNESFRATTEAEATVYKSSGGSLGVRTRVAAFAAITVVYQYTDREPVGVSHLISGILSFLL